MAIVKGPALSLEASGNLGAICYSTHGSLQIAKAVWTGTQPNTQLQIDQQGRLSTVSQSWGAVLTSAERKTWHDRAKSIVWTSRLGSPYIPNGYQLFMKWNIRRQVMGLGIMTTAPFKQPWAYVDAYQVSWNDTHSYIRNRLIHEVGVDIGAYGVEFYRAGPYDSGGRHPIIGEWRFLLRKVPPAPHNDSAIDLGKWYWCRGRQISEFGTVGNWFEHQVATFL